MSVNFSTNESVSLDKSVDNSSRLVHTDPDQLDYVYEIDNCARWIQKHGFKKVCLQFPDYLLADASEVASCLQRRLDQTMYILGDTAYESCCIDYVAAAHIDADAIVHYGPVCFSIPAETIPCLRIFEKHHLDLVELKKALEHELINRPNTVIVLDTPYATHVDSIRQMLQNVQLVTDDFATVDALVIIIGNNLRKILNFKLAHKLDEVFYYDPVAATLKNYDQDEKVLKRRNFLVEKIKDCETFGIIIGTVAVRNYLDVVKRVKKLIRVHGKKYYVISVGKPTVAKLANFPEIDVYVMITCGMNEIYDSRDFYKPVVTPYDVEMALNPHWKDSQFSYDFNSYLTIGADVTKEDVDRMENDVSLISGKLRARREESVDEVGSEVVAREHGTLALNSSFGAGFLAQRTWKGLEQNLGCDKPDVVGEGRRGVAQRYKNEN